MHINDGIDPVLCACRDGTIEVLETLRLQHARIHVILEVTVVDRDADTVEAERFEECRIWLGEEVLKELKSTVKINTMNYVFCSSLACTGIPCRRRKLLSYLL